MVLTCSDYFKSTGVLAQQQPKGLANSKKRDKKRKRTYRNRHLGNDEHAYLFKRKAKKNALTLKTIDIKDSFKHVFSSMNLKSKHDNHHHHLQARPLDRSNPKKSTTGQNPWKNCTDDGSSHLFSIINVNDIIRETGALNTGLFTNVRGQNK